jgi:hypothetical protein
MKQITEHELLLNERYYYQEKKREAMGLPPGDERAIRVETYGRVLDILNAAIWGNQRASTERIAECIRLMEEQLSQTMEWQNH